MDSTRTFPITFDQPSRIPMTVVGAGPRVSRVEVSPSTLDIRLGWAFQATIPRETIASARSLNGGLSEVPRTNPGSSQHSPRVPHARRIVL